LSARLPADNSVEGSQSGLTFQVTLDIRDPRILGLRDFGPEASLSTRQARAHPQVNVCQFQGDPQAEQLLTGALEKSLSSLSERYERDLEGRVNRLISGVEPSQLEARISRGVRRSQNAYRKVAESVSASCRGISTTLDQAIDEQLQNLAQTTFAEVSGGLLPTAKDFTPEPTRIYYPEGMQSFLSSLNYSIQLPQSAGGADNGQENGGQQEAL
jgi:hypothetical protein